MVEVKDEASRESERARERERPGGREGEGGRERERTIWYVILFLASFI